MSELLTMVEEQNKAIERLTKMVRDLSILVMKNKVTTTWVDEGVAAEILGYKDPRTLRKLVKSKALDIDGRNTNGKNWQYSLKSINRYQERTAI